MNLFNSEYAAYLPAVNLNYAKALVSKVPKHRPFPSDFSLGDFAFWEKDSDIWHYPYLLHSAGQYNVGAGPNNAITRRGSNEGVLFGDSAGYQIGMGTLKSMNGLSAGMLGDDALSAWNNNVGTRAWILNWLETYANYSMTIDMPLWATLPRASASPFHRCTEEQLLQMTVNNLHYIDRNRLGRTKWLNVIQGLDTAGMIEWWRAVKWFDCSGYAFSAESGKSKGLRAVLEPLLTMRDEGAFEEGHDWIHVLGCSTAPWAIMCTAIQRAIRAAINPNLSVTFDSASPFQEACIREGYCTPPSYGNDTKDWSIKSHRAPQKPSYVGNKSPLPFSSPLADKLTVGDLNVREGIYQKNQFDKFSHLFLMNHNVWIYLRAFQIANDVAFACDRRQVPLQYSECTDAIEEVFRVENWQEFLSENKKLLDGFRG